MGHVMTVVIERNDDMWTAQCDPYDICTQGGTLDLLLARLRHQIGAEIYTAGRLESVPKLPTAEDVRGILNVPDREA